MKNNFFDQQFLEAQNKKLITEKERLEKELNLHGRRGNANQNDFQANYENLGDDEESNAAEYGLAEANIDLVRNLELELRRVTAALERLRAGMRYLRDTPDLWQLTRPELRNILQAHLPGLYVVDGLIVGAPVTG